MAPTIRRLVAIIAVLALTLVGVATALASHPPGPPFHDPVPGQRVYDDAGDFLPATIVEAERIIKGVEERTGAQVAVLSQGLDHSPTYDEALGHAQALMREWGVGRKGFDDGLVILFDLDPTRVHGQVILWAGDGYRSHFLSDAERQVVFDQRMLPRLEAHDLDGALLAGLRAVDENATPAHAQALETDRQLNAALGFVGAPVVLLVLVGWALFHWLRYGRDPVYLDSPSIHVPAPPAGVTAATGAVIWDDGMPTRAFTAALLDLASRGGIAFEEDPDADRQHRPSGSDRGFRILLGEQAAQAADADLVAGGDRAAGARPVGDAVAAARLRLEDRRPLGPAELALAQALSGKAAGDVISAEKVTELGSIRDQFQTDLEAAAVAGGWFREPPHSVLTRWRLRGTAELLGGGAAVWAGFSVPMSGLTLVGAGLIAAAIVTFVVGEQMPARTMSGAMAKAWLAAYRRTLEKTMAMAASITEVPEAVDLTWLETPDQVAVWATALGLTGVLGDLLERSATQEPSSGLYYSPLWYRAWPAGSGGSQGGGFGGFAPGRFSSSGVPDFGGMVSALGTIGNAAPIHGPMYGINRKIPVSAPHKNQFGN